MFRQKNGLIFCKFSCIGFYSWASSLNVQDIIIERTKETSISSTCMPIPSTTIADKSVYASIRCRAYLAGPTHNVGLPTQFRFNVGPASQPIAGSMPVNRIRRWPNIETVLGDCPVSALTAIRVTFHAQKGHYPDNTIHWPNCEIMLGHLSARLVNIILTKTL